MEFKMEYVYITIHAQVFKVKHGSRMIELHAKLAKGNNYKV